MKFIDLTGLKFGRLVAERYVGKNKYGQSLWLCKCDCGDYKLIITSQLNSGETNSCGCLRKELNTTHGYTCNRNRPRIYHVWEMIKDRCNNPNNKQYKNYGGRGITICERWLKFENFLEDIVDIPKGLSVDRIDNNKGYFLNNIRLSTRKQQARNKRNTLYVMFNGQNKLLIEIAEEYNVSYKTLWHKFKKNKMSIEELINYCKKKKIKI